MMGIVFLRVAAVLAQTGFKKSTLYKEIGLGTFPAPIPLSERCVGWPKHQIDAWCKAKAQGRTLHFERPQPEPEPKPKATKRSAPLERIRA
jgi:prophage regulatory protein